MTAEQRRTIQLIARWLNESVSVSALGGLTDHLRAQATTPEHQTAEELQAELEAE